MKHKIISAAVLVATVLLPFASEADVISLQPLTASPFSPLSCFDFTTTLKLGSKSYAVRGLQYALIHEGSTISPSEYGVFGQDTLAAVNAFQQKYANDILKDGGSPTGLVGKMTRAKLNLLYGCSVLNPAVLPTSVVLSVKNVSLDNNGVTVTFCNQSPTDIPIFPVRVRLNGIIRDFNVAGALSMGTCDIDTIPYSVWGLTYDAGATYGVVTAIDPNNTYKTSKVVYPLTATTTISIPAISGVHISVRGISIKSSGLQGTVCNLGTNDLNSYPVRVTVNGVSKDVDVPDVHTHGLCKTIIWTYDMFGLVGSSTPVVGTVINGSINVDPNNVINDTTNKFDNSAAIVGSI